MNEFEKLIRALCDPARYDHVVDDVELIETHISAVLLAGEYVYKIKKPVDFGFVDFSTLCRRKFYCEEELRLNRRFAPDLYLGVTRISGDPDSPRLDGGGPAIEYAVKMARFDQDVLLDRCITRAGRVTVDMIETFATDVAVVHEEADVARPEDGYGTATVVRSNLAECWEPTRRIGLDDNGLVNGLARGMDDLARTLAPAFERRLREGRVRECHGDLHLGNLYLAANRIRAFDCIEFNPSLRWIDVASDVAFCGMDLRYHGRWDLARRLRNAYLEAYGDYAMLEVLRFYEVYRALVRAKVAGLREQARAGSGIEDARAHLQLAARLSSERAATPLIITHGLSGSGKTRVSGTLVENSEAVRVRSDVERDRWVAADSDRYTSANIDRVYRHLESRVATIIGAGYAAIVDATFLKRAHRERFRALAQRLGASFHILHCTAPERELRRRVAKRAASGIDASEADLGVLDYQLRELEPLGHDEQADVVVYDTSSAPTIESVLPALELQGADGR